MRHIIFPIFFVTFIFPQHSKLYKNVEHISQYLASQKFKILSTASNDLALIDSIYIKMVNYENHNYSEALLALTFALIPVRKVKLKLPIINTVYYPLVSVSDSIFNLKNNSLPKYIFWDSPYNDFGDKDKLSHFFGSAFISYNSHIFDFGNLIGYFIEVFEKDFKVQSSIDKRDMMTNTLGIIFGDLLKQNKNILPSHILITRTLIYFDYTL